LFSKLLWSSSIRDGPSQRFLPLARQWCRLVAGPFVEIAIGELHG
jgi:hypothetical protein